MAENFYRKRRRLAKEAAKAAKAAKPLGFIYFVGAEEVGRVKIGWSSYDPDARFLAIYTSSPVKLSKLGLLRGVYEREKELHVRFASHSVHLEWFDLCDEIAQFIKEEARDWATVVREVREATTVKAEVDHAAMMRDLRESYQKSEREISAAYMMGLDPMDGATMS